MSAWPAPPEPIHGLLWSHRLPKAARAEVGRSRRDSIPLEAHAELCLPASRASALSILRAQDEHRVEDLVPIRYGRMLATPFTYLRGSAAVMAADLAAGPRTDLDVQLCGDAHLSNFGLFSAPDRRLVFDLNDFDETHPGPFEWDVKRLAASVMVAGRNNGFTRKECRSSARAAVKSYRTALAASAAMDPLELFYYRFEFDEMLAAVTDKKALIKKRSKGIRKKAARKNSLGALTKLTHVVDGRRAIRPDPPLVTPLSEDQREEAIESIDALFDEYICTISADRRSLLRRYSLTDIARKIVGVGSVGTRCFIALFESGDGEPLFLQLKEATPSVLEAYTGPSEFEQAGQRVVTGQQIIQAAADAFLGWGRYEHAEQSNQPPVDFYFRQLWDGKYSANIEELAPIGLRRYAEWCGAAIARAHARAGDASMITGYLGDDDTFDRAVAAFAVAYADLTEADHAELLAGVEAGDITIVSDL